MEEKRTIWIVAAVGIFLAVVLVSARVVSRSQASAKNVVAKYTGPKGNSATGESSGGTQSASDEATGELSSGWTKDDGTADGSSKAADGITPTARVNDMTVVAQNATVFALQREQTSSGTSAAEPPKVTVAPIDLNQIGSKSASVPDAHTSSTTAKENTNIASTKTEQKPSSKKETSSASQASVAKAPPVVKKVVVEKTAPVASKAAPAKSAPKAQKPNETTWWVQAASFSSLKYADNARETLGNNKINADVFTYKDVSGKVFYRVRVGPYLTKSEAEYWKDRIGQIESFAATQSFVVRG